VNIGVGCYNLLRHYNILWVPGGRMKLSHFPKVNQSASLFRQGLSFGSRTVEQFIEHTIWDFERLRVVNRVILQWIRLVDSFLHRYLFAMQVNQIHVLLFVIGSDHQETERKKELGANQREWCQYFHRVSSSNNERFRKVDFSIQATTEMMHQKRREFDIQQQQMNMNDQRSHSTDVVKPIFQSFRNLHNSTKSNCQLIPQTAIRIEQMRVIPYKLDVLQFQSKSFCAMNIRLQLKKWL
jgi:hypothetical protein